MVFTLKMYGQNFLFQNREQGFLIISYCNMTYGSKEYDDELLLVKCRCGDGHPSVCFFSVAVSSGQRSHQLPPLYLTRYLQDTRPPCKPSLLSFWGSTEALS